MNLFQRGEFTLSSGKQSAWKIECDSLTDDDWACLAQMIQQMVGPFSSVEGVPTGGLKLAQHLYAPVGKDGPHLIVDDVLTTCGSMERAAAAWRTKSLAENRGLPPYVGAVVFARGACPPWIRAVFQMPGCLGG